MPRDREYAHLADYIRYLSKIGADAVIVGDIGVLSLVRDVAPELDIHLSTQASAVSSYACRAWHALGARRIVLARELTLREISEIRKNTPPELELEVFIHGAMCIAYSGRCLLSNCLTGRDANRGECAQPCRWNYTVKSIEVTEEKRPGGRIPIEEDDEGTYVMSSRDLCMIEHIPELIDAGIDSFKIEGRVKSAYYGAVTANAYRIAIDRYVSDPQGYTFDPALLRELESVSHREYCTGFFYGSPANTANTVSYTGYLRDKAYLAVAISHDETSGRAVFRQKNRVCEGDAAEIVSPGKTGRGLIIYDLKNSDGEPIESAPHPGMLFSVNAPFPIAPGDMLRGI
jgi:putative protease